MSRSTTSGRCWASNFSPSVAEAAVSTVTPRSRKTWPRLCRAESSSSMISKVDIVVLGDVLILGTALLSFGKGGPANQSKSAQHPLLFDPLKLLTQANYL